MLNKSVARNYVQNQQQSSWNDDPYDLKGSFKGLNVMSNERCLASFTEELVAQYAKYSHGQYQLFIDMLPADETNELVRLYIENTGRETSECVYGNDFSVDNEYVCALLSMLKNDCEETRNHFAEVTVKNIVIYYTESLNELLGTACDTYQVNEMNESGYYSNQYADNGEVIWGKF